MSFERLEAIIKARTPGPWSQNGFYVIERDEAGLVVADCFSTKNGREANNGAFIATMGTIADLMMDCVKANEVLLDKLRNLDVAMAQRDGSFLIRSAATPAAYWEHVVSAYQANKGALTALRTAVSWLEGES